MNQLDLLVQMIKESKNIVFFGGAGVSTESGVKDYRSEDGLYNTVHSYGVSPEEILSHHFFFEHTDVFYDFYYQFFLKDSVKPNKAHLALARLEKTGKLKAVITQNIDGLHQEAGSKTVIELHGTTFEHFCVSCGSSFEKEKIEALKGGIPHCENCGGLVKPKVVLYEESLDQKAISDCIEYIQNADMLIIGGTSLAVYPAAGFIRYFRGKNLVLINRDETPYDSHASLVIHDKIGEVLDQVVKQL